MSLNSYLVTNEIRPLPGSGWTSKNAANAQDSIAKYKEKLNIPRGQKGYIEPDTFKLKRDINNQELLEITPKRSCVVDKPECVKYNYVIPKKYLQEGVVTAKIENQILENELDELQAQHGELQTTHSELQQQHGNLQQHQADLQQQRDALQQQQTLIQLELEATRDILREVDENKTIEVQQLNKDIMNLVELLEKSQTLNNFLNSDSDMYKAPSTGFNGQPAGPPPVFNGPPAGHKNLGGIKSEEEQIGELNARRTTEKERLKQKATPVFAGLTNIEIKGLLRKWSKVLEDEPYLFQVNVSASGWRVEFKFDKDSTTNDKIAKELFLDYPDGIRLFEIKNPNNGGKKSRRDRKKSMRKKSRRNRKKSMRKKTRSCKR